MMADRQPWVAPRSGGYAPQATGESKPPPPQGRGSASLHGAYHPNGHCPTGECFRRTDKRPFCNTWPWPNSDNDIVNPEDNDKVHKARGCCDGWL